MFGTCYNAILICEGLKNLVLDLFLTVQNRFGGTATVFFEWTWTGAPQKGTRSSPVAIINVIDIPKASQLKTTAVQFIRVLSSAPQVTLPERVLSLHAGPLFTILA
jgi:hypothetical protein